MHDPAGFAEPRFQFFADLHVSVGAPQDVGATARGRRRVVPITGGTATGNGWHARVLPGGADVQLVVNARMTQLDARYVLEMDGGDLVYVHNRAVRSGPPELMAQLMRGEPVDPAHLYFRCCPTFETASHALAWTAERMFVGQGARHPDKVVMRFHELL